MTQAAIQEWITTKEAARLAGYTAVYIRRLIRTKRVNAVKRGRDWLIDRVSLLAYKARMDALGTQKHNPWREDANE
ncbi:MAG: helix-turn-helix domain-containing protein [Anaerolineae bacterium]|nr:helix-turn-helix domain-containing protein [Anaerolineae bacterium]